MYKKVELKNGFVGMENKVAEMWKQKNIIKQTKLWISEHIRMQEM